MPVFAGIDYSLTSPAICIHDTKNGVFSYDTVILHFRSNQKRFDYFKDGNVRGRIHNFWKDEIERYNGISRWALSILQDSCVSKVYIEGYSFASTGKVFNIAENTGILKYNLYFAGIPFEVIAPTTVKKFATGSGRATKEDMYNQFCDDNENVNLKEMLTPRSNKIISPLNDIVDAYYILKCGLFN